MTLLRSERRAVTHNELRGRGEDYDGWQPLTGERISFAKVIGLDAAGAAVGLLSDIVSMLPAHGYQDVDGVATRLPEPPPLIATPSPTVDPITWKAQAMVSWLLWGNAYGLVLDRDPLGHPTMVEWLDPAQVRVAEQAPTGRARWFVAGKEVAAERILHVPGRHVRPGSILGLAPLTMYRETFGLALAARNYGARWFGEGAHPSAILQSEQAVDEPAAKTIKDRFIAATRKKREPAVLGLGMEYKEIQKGPQDSQMLETQRHMIGAVARAIGLPAEMIGGAAEGSSVTYANREQRSIDLLTFYVDPWLVRFEWLWTSNMARPHYAKVNRGALLRTDMLTRYKVHDTAIRGGMRSPDEARSLEDEPAIPDGAGDVFLWPPYATSLAPVQPQEAP